MKNYGEVKMLNLTPREEALIEFLLANYDVVHKTDKDQSVIDYNVMMGKLDDPESEEE